MPGPYGTNEGDVWSVEDSQLGEMLAQDGLVLVHEMLVRDGEPQECLYVTQDAGLIARAREGQKLWVAARAAMN